jgi:hypothetical protein
MHPDKQIFLLNTHKFRLNFDELTILEWVDTDSVNRLAFTGDKGVFKLIYMINK